MKWINEHLTSLTFIEDSCCLTTLCMPVRFLNLLNQPLLALNSLTATLIPGLFFARSACSSLAFLQVMTSETLSPANYCSLIHTNNNFSTPSIVCDLCLFSTFTPYATSASLIFFFSSSGWN